MQKPNSVIKNYILSSEIYVMNNLSKVVKSKTCNNTIFQEAINKLF